MSERQQISRVAINLIMNEANKMVKAKAISPKFIAWLSVAKVKGYLRHDQIRRILKIEEDEKLRKV